MLRLQQPAPRLQADLLARVARLEQVGGQPADGEIVVVGQADQLVHRQVAGVGAGVLGGVGAGRVRGRVEQAEHRLVQAERPEGALLELRHVGQHPDDELVHRPAAHAHQPGHPARLDLAERGAEVGLEAVGGELADPIAPGPLQQAEQRPRAPPPELRERPVVQVGPALLEMEARPVVVAGLVIEDVVGDPGGVPGRRVFDNATSTSAAASA